MTIQQALLVGGKPAERTYVDETFKINTYIGNGVSGSGTRTITHGLKYGDDPGMVISKQIENNSGSYKDWYVYSGSTWNGGSHKTNAGTYADYAHTGGELTATNNTYQVTGTGFKHNANDKKYVSYMFKKTAGFFTHKQYTGTGSTQTLSHDLGAVPGMIWVHRTNQFNTTNWAVYHKGQNKGVDPEDYRLVLNTNTTENNDTYWGDTAPTSTQFTVGDSHNEVNADGDTYTAYFFAGGPSSAATAKSVDFDGSDDYLSLASSSDFDIGTGDFTVECWVNPDALTTSGHYKRVWEMGTSAADSIGIDVQPEGICNFRINDTVIVNTGSKVITENQWTHIAVCRQSSTLTLYINGQKKSSASNSTDIDQSSNTFRVGANHAQSSTSSWNGRISNFRYVKGTAVYTSSFSVPLEPLTNITNTKLLCCNNSSVTGSTVTPGTITANGSATASTNSPFDDPLGQIFGKSSNKPIIKCGNYTGNGDATNGTRVYLGFEPQWVMIKSTGFTEEWHVFDVLRGITSDADNRLELSQDGQQLTGTTFLSIDASGFIAKHNPNINKDNEDFIYMAIRRADGYVGKPVETATNVFAMDTGASSSAIPNFDSGFDVDYTFMKNPGSTSSWYTYARLTQKKELVLNTNAGEGGASSYTFDSNLGWGAGGDSSSTQSWMWKRHAGFDVVCYLGLGGSKTHKHSLGIPPEMMWIKCKANTSTDWWVYHKGLNGGTNPENYYIVLNSTAGEVDQVEAWNDTAPTDISFTVGANSAVNSYGDGYIAILFASVAGISKLDKYSGSSGVVTVECGFVPRLVIIKKRSADTGSSHNGWLIFDTLRGIADGNDSYMFLDTTSAANASYDVLDLVDSGGVQGFSVPTTGSNNDNGAEYIYYAHA